MLKWFKKHKLKFFSCFALSFCLSLFCFMAFSTKTYAYSINEDGNLVGDNLLDINNPYSIENASIQNYNIIVPITSDNKTTHMGTGTYTSVTRWEFRNINNSINSLDQTFTTDSNHYVLYFITGSATIKYDLSNYSYGTYNLSGSLIYNNDNVVYMKYMLVEGNMPKEWEPYGVWYNSTNYDLLDSQVNLLKYGWLNYIDELDLKITNSLVKSFTFQELLSGGYISTTSSFDLHQLSLYQNPNYSYIDIDIYFSDNLNNQNWFNYNLFNFSTKLLFNGVISIFDTNNINVTFNIIDVDTINYEKILLQNSDFNGEIESVSIHFSSPDNSTLIYTNSYYSLGFQNGVSQSSFIYQPQIDNLNNHVLQLTNTNNTLQNNLNNLQQSLSNLQVAYNDLNTSYTNMLNGNNFANLFFTIAETPFASFKQIWNVDFLGVNLAGFVTGILFIGLLIWVVKKIF